MKRERKERRKREEKKDEEEERNEDTEEEKMKEKQKNRQKTRGIHLMGNCIAATIGRIWPKFLVPVYPLGLSVRAAVIVEPANMGRGPMQSAMRKADREGPWCQRARPMCRTALPLLPWALQHHQFHLLLVPVVGRRPGRAVGPTRSTQAARQAPATGGERVTNAHAFLLPLVDGGWMFLPSALPDTVQQTRRTVIPFCPAD